MLSWLPLIGTVVDKVFGIIDEAVEDKDKANEIKSKLSLQTMAMQQELDSKRADIIIAEAKGESWIQRSWRPILMLTIVAIIANNYVLFPYLSMFTTKATVLELPPALYTLLTVGVGGYIVGRSGEKVAQAWKDKQ